MSAEVRTARAVFTATTRDLSEGGAGLSADRPLEEGEDVTIGLSRGGSCGRARAKAVNTPPASGSR